MDPFTADELRALRDSWVISLQAERKSPETIRSYVMGVDKFLTWCEDSGMSADLTRARVNTWITSLGDLSPATARARQLAVRRFSAWLAEEGEIPADELVGIRAVKLDQKVTPALTDDQVAALLAACRGERLQDVRDAAIVTVMVETGIRAGECAALQLDHVDLANQSLTVIRGKGGKGRGVYLPPDSRRALDRYLRRGRRNHARGDSPALWVGERGKTFSYDSLHKALTKRGREAGIEGFHPHLLRHTFATNWLADGGSEGGLMSLAGWTRREMLDRYTRATATSRAIDEARKLRG
ncbi:tyrosine-type recombinase/integrase [Pseudonocardia alni]|uniref:tyrosine-type recombinase/integrase n=1 Tax=Pseudonocardia alni TaxID=33907 RepID=UPI0033CBB3B7